MSHFLIYPLNQSIQPFCFLKLTLFNCKSKMLTSTDKKTSDQLIIKTLPYLFLFSNSFSYNATFNIKISIKKQKQDMTSRVGILIYNSLKDKKKGTEDSRNGTQINQQRQLRPLQQSGTKSIRRLKGNQRKKRGHKESGIQKERK